MTLSEIKARCSEDGDCLIWTGATNAGGHPKFSRASGRRVVWELVHGTLQPADLITVTCGCSLCLNPQHLKKTTKSEVSRVTNARPDIKAKRIASNQRSAREKGTKITMETARMIRASDKTGLALAAELQVSPSLITSVRKNKTWREHGNPFAGLMR